MEDLPGEMQQKELKLISMQYDTGEIFTIQMLAQRRDSSWSLQAKNTFTAIPNKVYWHVHPCFVSLTARKVWKSQGRVGGKAYPSLFFSKQRKNQMQQHLSSYVLVFPVGGSS